MADSPSDLLDRFRSGDGRAAHEIAERALRIGIRTATALVGDRERAADIAQDASMDVMRGVASVRTPDALDGWIHTIVVRRAMRELRKERLRRTREVALVDLADTLVDTADAPGEIAVRRAEGVELMQAIRQLPAKQRVAMVLRYAHDLSHEQIAEAMGVRPGTASALLSRAHAALRDRLNERSSEGGVGG